MGVIAHVLRGKITLLSPAIIGSGANEETDFDLLSDGEGNPFIPGTSIAGVFRSICQNYFNDNEIKKLFGFTEGNNARASLLLFSDMPIQEAKIGKRTGVKIDNRLGRAEEKHLYEYQVIERGNFDLKIEAKTENDDDKKLVEKAFRCFYELLKEKIRLGAKTNSGFGVIGINQSDKIEYFQLDLANIDKLIRWLNKEYKEEDQIKFENLTYVQRWLCRKLLVKAEFKLKTSLIIRDYSVNPDLPDAVSLKSGDDYIISGTSIKGALRSRAEKILNTLGNDEKKTEEMLNDLFGYVIVMKGEENNIQSGAKSGQNRQVEKAKKGRLRVNEVKLENYSAEQQTRIKIDRFTGGALGGALLEEMPVFATEDGKPFTIEIEVENYKDWEAGLLLLLLKDLWTGDLPVGGEKSIGRGVLEGCQAEIIFRNEQGETKYSIIKKEKEILITNNDSEQGEEIISKLNNYVTSMAAKLTNSGEKNEQPSEPGKL